MNIWQPSEYCVSDHCGFPFYVSFSLSLPRAWLVFSLHQSCMIYSWAMSTFETLASLQRFQYAYVIANLVLLPRLYVSFLSSSLSLHNHSVVEKALVWQPQRGTGTPNLSWLCAYIVWYDCDMKFAPSLVPVFPFPLWPSASKQKRTVQKDR